MLVVSCVGVVGVSVERCARSEEKKKKKRDTLFFLYVRVVLPNQGFFFVFAIAKSLIEIAFTPKTHAPSTFSPGINNKGRRWSVWNPQ